MNSRTLTKALVGLVLISWLHSAVADVVSINADELIERTTKNDSTLVVVDVRSPDEFAQGHVPGAINIPVDKLPDRIGELLGAKSKDVVLYCRSGRRAAQAADTLKQNGFQKLMHLAGDMQKWTEEKRPVEK